MTQDEAKELKRLQAIERKELADAQQADEERKYRGYRFWCREGCGFVDRHHQCEQWTTLIYIPPALVEAFKAECR